MVELHKKLKTPEGKWYKPVRIHKHNHIEVLPIIDAALKRINDEGLERHRFLKSCFGHFLLMDRYMPISCAIVHQMLLRELKHDGPNDEMRFMLGGHSVRFSKIEFCLITGLRFGVVPNTAQYMGSDNGIHDRYFHGRSVVKIEAVKELVSVAQFQQQYDGVKLCLLLILNAFLHGSDKTADVPIWQLQLVEDLDAFDAFPWGSLIYCRSISSFTTALHGHTAQFEHGQNVRVRSKHNNERYNLYGFAYALQIFAFEIIPELARAYTSRTANEPFPRILKYSFWFRRKPRYGELRHITESMYALERIDPTPEEVGRGYFQGIFGDVQDLNAVPGCMTHDPPNISAPKTNYNGTECDTDIVAKKRKLPVEAALVEEPNLEPKKCTFKQLKLKDMGHCREAPSNQLCDEETVRMKNRKNLAEASPALEKADLASKESKEICTDGGPNSLEHTPLSPPSKDIMSKKRKTPVEAALVEQPRQVSKICTMQHLDQNLCYHPSEGSISPSLDQCPTSQENIQSSSLTKDIAPTGKTSLHPSLSDPSVASGFFSHFSRDNSSFHVNQQTKGLAGSPLSSLEDAMAFFTEIDSVLDKSPKDLLDSSHTTLATSEDIDQAKCLLQQCLFMNFELVVNSSQRDQVKSSLEELFLKVGHFPSDLLKMVRTFCVNFLRNIDAYSNCKEHVKRADKRKEERMTLKVEMAKNKSLFNVVKEEIKIAADEIEELEKRMAEEKKYKMDLEEQAKKLAEVTRKLKNDFDQLNVDFENLEKEKENSEMIMADIETQWDELRRKIADFL